MRKVVREVWDRAGNNEDMDFAGLVRMFMKNNVDRSTMSTLRAGFTGVIRINTPFLHRDGAYALV